MLNPSTYYKPHAMPYPSLFNLYNTLSSTLLNSSPAKETDHIEYSLQEHTMSLLNISSTDSKGNNYITSEKYNNLCNDSFYDILAHSDSTIFYDLDDIAKRNSIHCLTNLGQYNVNTETVIGMNTDSKRFVAQSDAIVQGLAIRNHKVIPRDSLEIVAKKVKRIISSDNVLRDDNYVRIYEENHRDNSREIHEPVYQPTRSISQDHSMNSNQSCSHRGPCPCQLFSCPYTEMKSLPESLIFVNELTSTSNIKENKNERNDGISKNKTKKNMKRDLIKEHKPTNTSIPELIEVMVPGKESDIPSIKDSPALTRKPTATQIFTLRDLKTTSLQIRGQNVH